MAGKTLKAGDKVKWDSAGGTAQGTVVKKETGTTKVKGHTAKASSSDPQYRVKSAKSGKEAVHKADELRKT
ncbi:DUF2945 domain-containing protein [Methylobacterium gnaphalii]|uniref:Hypervirulence associated protein TUDOR domain-containing protein n=1 Tax=Methylobacterium gnaphalii TaxID=1010610 RepID=A0A512JMI6_9HYPH|nr:DUF2945 domain-containing protein [Methylobacterium gnaphalii]GEP11186.1 hypothetical protein MGN01_30310 [Methylobacterium gnaphalii]GJD70055.1 hypothetical protein MMMDOFMJ_2995 [Methylobacterium gnaphalii]GLS49691.1 hypothetical protein GCM10007885_25410 [Methylobacterium gnaphalii]